MTDPRGHANHDGHFKFPAQPIGLFCHIEAFLRVRRLDHGDFHEFCIVAVILLILGRVHARIVCGDKGEAAVYGEIGEGEQRVRRHIDTDHFHSRKERTPAMDAPTAASMATFSLGAHSV